VTAVTAVTAPTALTGTGTLLQLALRRDRVLVPVWAAVLAFSAGSSAQATIGLYPTVQERVQAAASVNDTPALVALYGRIYDETSLGSIGMVKLNGFGAALVALLAIVLTVRHTRADEETGRLELVGAGVVGRQAALAAALGLVALTSVLVGALTALGLAWAGMPSAGALAFGAAWAGTGLAFGAVAAVTAQLTASARAATGLASVVLGAAYLLRAVGDVTGAHGQPGVLSWLSPIGWSQQVRAFAGDRWWVLALLVAFAGAASAAAVLLAGRRDLGGALLAGRPGPPRAGRLLSTSTGLAWRLQRGSLLGWTAGFLVLGGVVGGVATSAQDLLDSEQAREYFERLGGHADLVEMFLAAELSISAVVAAAYAVQAVLRLHHEEEGGRAEPVLATPVGRVRWALGHVGTAAVGSAVLMLAAGVAAALGDTVSANSSARAGAIVLGALVQLPAVLVMVGLVTLAVGVGRSPVAVSWALLVGFLLLGEIGPLLQLPQWTMDVSPFAHTPDIPGGRLTAVPLLALTAAGVALTAAGLVALRRRDVH
jgi:ABC-2 type transport system permease protein